VCKKRNNEQFASRPKSGHIATFKVITLSFSYRTNLCISSNLILIQRSLNWSLHNSDFLPQWLFTLNGWYFMSNVSLPIKLAQASYSLTLLGHKLKLLALSEVHPTSYFIGEAPVIIITAEDWLAVNSDSEQPYRDLKRALNDLNSARVKFNLDPKKYRFLIKGEYMSGRGRIKLQFCPEFLKACF
jgi:hypothetical protein